MVSIRHVLLASFLLGCSTADGGKPGDGSSDAGPGRLDGGSDEKKPPEEDILVPPLPPDGDTRADASTDADASGIVDAGRADRPATPPDAGRPIDDGGPKPPGPRIPPPAGPCPEFASGMATFRPAQGARTAMIYMTDAAKTLHGPLVFYWYATGGQPSQAQYALGDSLAAIQAAGGIVVAPAHTNAGTFPWISGDLDLEYLLADEILGCAAEKVGVDARHIHSLGFSAGALFTTQLGFARSGYLASVATYSGGMQGGAAPYQDPANEFAALIFHGGPSDVVVIGFEEASKTWQAKLKTDGHFAVICNHGGGHTAPTRYTGSVWSFFQVHAYGVDPSPWANGLPTTGFDICTF